MSKAGQKKRHPVRIVLCVLLILCVLLLVGFYVMCVSIYNENFNKRFESYEPLMFRVEDFDGLHMEERQFPSDRGQMLTGYLYSAGEDPHGIVVVAHGLGAGHNSYMDCANYFAHSGYLVFAYDATGCDRSEGEGVGGIPQGQIDLDYAISYVEDSTDIPDLPIVLFGHSWGAYSVSSVLTWHPEVKAVVECCGCNASSDLFEAGGRRQAGDFIDTMMPFIRLHERIRYGKYASNTALDAFASCETKVMCVHSEDDDVVPIGYGFDKYYAAYAGDRRFEFLRYEDRGHNYFFNDMTYIDEFNAAFDEWLTTLDYDYNADKERFAADKADYIHAHLDRARWSDMLDGEMFAAFLAFYDEAVAD